jgi:hypothetical protein
MNDEKIREAFEASYTISDLLKKRSDGHYINSTTATAYYDFYTGYKSRDKEITELRKQKTNICLSRAELENKLKVAREAFDFIIRECSYSADAMYDVAEKALKELGEME